MLLKIDNDIGNITNLINKLPLNDLNHPDHPTRLSSPVWGPLPRNVIDYYASKGVERLFGWQAEALTQSPAVLAGVRNLVYSAPTSAGKTMVADILLIKTLLDSHRARGSGRGGKALIILPYIAIAFEKTESLKPLMKRIGKRIDCFAGNVNPRGGFDRVAVAVCTIEKANNMLNKLLEEGKLNEIGLIVVDEMHMIEDAHRGYFIELLLSKVLFYGQRQKQNGSAYCGPQIIGMSATIANLPELARWLNAELYVTDWRPVPLHLRVVNGLEVLEQQQSSSIVIDGQDFQKEDTVIPYNIINLDDFSIDPTTVGQLSPLIHAALETLAGGHSALIFCPTKKFCEDSAEKIARHLHGLITAQPLSDVGKLLRSRLSEVKIRNLLERLQKCSSNSTFGEEGKLLQSFFRFGVAFHHGGLSTEERTLVEGGYRDGTLRILFSTTTLSAGVNLPARRVLIWTPLKYDGTLMDVTTYRQMVGRAGRMGIDELGEAMLFCRAGTKDYELALKGLLFAQLPPICSALLTAFDEKSYSTQSLYSQNKNNISQVTTQGPQPIKLSISLKRAVLEVLNVGNGAAAGSAEDIRRYIAECTFFGVSKTNSNSELLEAAIAAVIDFFIEKRFIYRENGSTTADLNNNNSSLARLQISLLGKAIVASGLSPDDAPFYQAELEQASKRLCLLNDLQLVYQLTPTFLAEQYGPKLDWRYYVEVFFKLTHEERIIATELIGIEEGFLWNKVARNGSMAPAKGSPAASKLLIHCRFYIALALYDLVQEVSPWEVSKKYRLERTTLQTLQTHAATFAGQLTIFAGRLRWSNLELLFEQFQPRLNFGAQRELLELMRIPGLTTSLARRLHERGLSMLAVLAWAPAWTVEEALISTRKFESATANQEKEVGDAAASMLEFLPAHGVSITIRDLVKHIKEEAKALLGSDLGLQKNTLAHTSFFELLNDEEEEEQFEAAIDELDDIILDDLEDMELMEDLSWDSL